MNKKRNDGDDESQDNYTDSDRDSDDNEEDNEEGEEMRIDPVVNVDQSILHNLSLSSSRASFQEHGLEIRTTLSQRPNEQRPRVSLPQVNFSPSTKPAADIKPKVIINPRLLYKGRKYDWNAKVNMHLHLIEHCGADCIEIIAFHTSSFIEAAHVFVSAPQIYSKAADQVELIEKIDAIAYEFDRLKLAIPDSDTILAGLVHHNVVEYLLKRMVIQTKPIFAIDIKEERKSSLAAGSTAAATTTTTTTTTTGNENANNGRRMSNARFNSSNDNVPLYSISIKKPENVVLSEVKRFGKSATLVGDVENVKSNQEDEIMEKIVSGFYSSSLPNQAQRIIGNLTVQSIRQRRKSRVMDFSGLRGFSKFRNDNDLLQESLSFLHVSDMMLLQRVCKRWRTVLSYALKFSTSLWISSRDFYFNDGLTAERQLSYRPPQSARSHTESLADLRARSRGSTAGSVSERGIRNQFSTFFVAPTEFAWRKVFVLPQTTLLLIKNSMKYLVDFRLHYVIIDREMLSSLTSLGGQLKRLSIGIIKVDDKVYKEEKVEKKEVPPSPSLRPHRPSLSLPSSRSIFNRRNTSPAVGNPLSSNNSVSSSQSPARSLKSANEVNSSRPPLKVAQLRYLNVSDLKTILMACGNELTSLELSATIGALPKEVFKFVPRLVYFAILDTLIAPKVVCSSRDLQGDIPLDSFVNALKDIQIPHLLAMISDAHSEAFLLTDKRGKIVVANDAWLALFDYENADIVSKGLDFLSGGLTDKDELGRILEGIKTQIHPEECVTFLHGRDRKPFLCQVLLVPNVAKYRGPLLQADCLGSEFLGQLAMEQDESTSNEGGEALKSMKNKKDWRLTSKETSYHLLRFGTLCEPFYPYGHHVFESTV
eukprot:gene2194-2394_t